MKPVLCIAVLVFGLVAALITVGILINAPLFRALEWLR